VSADGDICSPCAHTCQADSLVGASTRVPRTFDLLLRAREKLRREGVGQAMAKILHFLTPGSDTSTPRTSDAMPRRALPQEQEVLGLNPGEWVEVKSLPEILATLDAEEKMRGLEFLPGMHQFCGKRFKVLKRMVTLYQEESGQVRRLKNTVLLTDVQCDGLLMRCDRSCYLFWREAWLRRVADPKGPDISTRQSPEQSRRYEA
jgi:hypothetical protein